MARISALSNIVRERRADAMLLTGETSLIYATGCTGLEGQLLVFPDEAATFITDGRYTEVAERDLLPAGFDVQTRRGSVSVHAFLRNVVDEKHISTILYEDDVLTVEDFARLRESLPCSFAALRGAVSALRQCKSPEEIRCITRAQRIAEQALRQTLPALHTGITERAAAALLDYNMACLGSEKPSFDTIFLFGENASRPHGIPSGRTLKPGDVVLVDFGAVLNGYHSDMTRTFVYGAASDEVRRAYEVVLRAQDAAQAAARPGVPCSELHNAAAAVIAQAGYGERFTHSLGHSVGLEIHEMPVAAPRCDAPLAAGVVMTDEPGIYIPGQFGIRIEDMLVITADGCENITQYPKALTELAVIEN